MRPALILVVAAACGSTPSTSKLEVPAPRPEAPALPLAKRAKGAFPFGNLGKHHRVVTTSSKEASDYFQQGLRLTYGFNHDEATRSFARATIADPECAMCYWGAALTLGPNYKVPMLPEAYADAWAALQRAIELGPTATPVERALIGALARRYPGPEPVDPPAMQPYNAAYAAQMREVAEAFPADDDVQVLFAEAAMTVNPWQLWSRDGVAAEGTAEIVATLETVLARSPEHPGANHYYIHAVEASTHPEQALASAERLAGLMPDSGHTVHMSAHIFQRVGRYGAASAANRRAIEVDLAYLAKTTPVGYYPMYLGHNWGFLAYSASMQGRKAEALHAARESAKQMPPGMMDMMPGMDFFVAEPLLVMVRFGQWEDLLLEPRPDAKYMVFSALWLHAHGMALAATGKIEEAKADLAELVALEPAEGLLAGMTPAPHMFALAAKVLEAKIATVTKAKDAIALWTEAVALEDQTAYSEPADWFYPTRHYLGAALLAAGKAKDAEAVYREDLRRNPENGWALFGLHEALVAQNKRAKDAAEVQARFEATWAEADLQLKTTAF